MKTVALILLSIIVSGCGGDSTPGAPTTKELFSMWRDTQDVGHTIHFSYHTFSTNQLTWISGPDCSCLADMSGDEESGTVAIHGCVPAAPSCADVSYSYTNSNAILTTCDSSMNCTVWR